MTAQGLSEEEINILHGKNDETLYTQHLNSPYLPRSKKKRKTNHLIQKIFPFLYR